MTSRLRLSLVGVALSILVVTIGTALWQRPNNTTPTSSAAEPAVIAQDVSEPVLIGKSLMMIDQEKNAVVLLDLGVTTLSAQEVVSGSVTVRPSPTFENLLVYKSGSNGWQSLALATGAVTTLTRGVHTPTWSPDGRRLAYVFIPEDRGRATLTIANTDGTEWHNVLELDHFYDALWWSPLETYMVGLDAEHPEGFQYVRIFLSSKRTETLAPALPDGDLRWSPDGKQAIIDRVEGGVRLVAIETGAVRVPTLVTSVRHAAWETATSFLAIEHDGTGTVKRVEAATLDVTTLGTLPTDVAEYQLLGVLDETMIVYGESRIVQVPLSALSS